MIALTSIYAGTNAQVEPELEKQDPNELKAKDQVQRITISQAL